MSVSDSQLHDVPDQLDLTSSSDPALFDTSVSLVAEAFDAAASDHFVDIDQPALFTPQSIGSTIARQPCKWMQPGDVNEGSLTLTASQLCFDINEEALLKKRKASVTGAALRQQWTWNLYDIR